MAAPTETYIDPADGAAAGNDHGGAAFVDGSFANATNTLTKVGAFTAATCQAGDKIYLDDNGSGEVTAALYTIQTRTDDDNVVLTADIRSGAPDPTDVRCDQHTGAVGLPWATVQHALDFTTRDAADGDRFNVKTGTDDVLAAALDFSTYGSPTDTAPWICQGYTASAGDGGIGGISGAGSYTMIATATLDYLHFYDMHLHNSGAATILNLDDYIRVINCELDNTTGDGFECDVSGLVVGCYIHNIGTKGIDFTDRACMAFFNTLENGTNDFTEAIRLHQSSHVAMFNVIDIDGSSDGIYIYGDYANVMYNSVYSSSGTGTGIYNHSTAEQTIILNNIVEGFSGVGGIGIESLGGSILMLGYNAFYNNTTDESHAADIWHDLGNDVTLSASAFLDAANDDFRVKPSVQGLGYLTDNFPNLSVRGYYDIGALQRKSQMIVHPGMAGGARG